MKKLALLVALTVTMIIGGSFMQSSTCYAETPQKNVPAYRGIIERTQPNGDVLRTYLRGDERKHWSMTEDGWQIMEGKNGWFRYAKLNRKGEVVIGCRKAHNADKRSKCEKRWLERHGIKKDAAL